MHKTILRAVLTAAAAAAVAATLLAGGSAQASSPLPTLTLSATHSSIAVGGAQQSGAVNIVTTSAGTKEAAVILFALRPGVSVAEAYAFLESRAGKDINSSSKYGSIVYDVEAIPGKSVEAQTNLEAGQYLALLVEGEGPPKVRTSFTVTPAASPAVLPTPQATIRSIEFGFRGPSTLHDGELVRFENEGFLVHMDIAAPVKNMTAAKKAVKLLLANKEKQVEKLIAGQPVTLAGPLSHGSYQQETITAKPGIYLQLCFMDTQDGRSHTALGMERIIRITK